MERYTIIHRPDDLSLQLSNTIDAHLQRTPSFMRDDANPHIVIVVGGDGTFIYAVHQYIGRLNDVCFYGIHTGTLGFYTDYKDTDLDAFLDNLIRGSREEITYPLLRVSVGNKDYYAINEVRIENAARTQVMNVYINDQHLETFRGTGMCVCTQLGSTAYNRSLGGAVIEEGLDFIELTEISGIHHSKYRSLDAPLVLKSNAVITFTSDCFGGALLGVDSEVYPFGLETKVRVKVCESMSVHVLRGRKVSYYERLKSLF